MAPQQLAIAIGNKYPQQQSLTGQAEAVDKGGSGAAFQVYDLNFNGYRVKADQSQWLPASQDKALANLAVKASGLPDIGNNAGACSGFRHSVHR